MFRFSFGISLIIIYPLVVYTKEAEPIKYRVEIQPPVDTFLPTGSSLNITCRYRPCEGTSINIAVIRSGIKRLPDQSHIEPCTTTFIKVNATKDDSAFYSCFVDDVSTELVPVTRLEIGDQPQVEPFRCVSSNFDDANCSWCFTAKLGWEHLNTTLEIRLNDNLFQCSKFLDDCTCHICGCRSFQKYGFGECQGESQKRQFVRFGNFNFKLRVANKFGVTTQEGSVELDTQLVKPDGVRTLIATKLTGTTVHLTWDPPEGLEVYKLYYWVQFTSKYGQHVIPLALNSRNTTLRDLTPYTVYNVSVWCKPLRGGYLSDPVTVAVRTMEKAPGACPVVSEGGYLSVLSQTSANQRTVYIYFEMLPEEVRNGILLGYNITYHEVGDTASANMQVAIPASAVVAELDLEAESQYSVTLTAYNAEGESKDCHPVTIFAHQEYEMVASIEGEDNGTHITFYWAQPQSTDFESILLLECEASSRLDQLCQSRPKFISVPASKRTYLHEKQGGSDVVYSSAAVFKRGNSGLSPFWMCIRPIHGDTPKPTFGLDPHKPDPPLNDKPSLEVQISPPVCDHHTGRVLWYNLTWAALPKGKSQPGMRYVQMPGENHHYTIKDVPDNQIEIKLQAIGHKGPSEWVPVVYPANVITEDTHGILWAIIATMCLFVIIGMGIIVGLRRHGYRRIQECLPRFQLPPWPYSTGTIPTGSEETSGYEPLPNMLHMVDIDSLSTGGQAPELPSNSDDILVAEEPPGEVHRTDLPRPRCTQPRKQETAPTVSPKSSSNYGYQPVRRLSSLEEGSNDEAQHAHQAPNDATMWGLPGPSWAPTGCPQGLLHMMDLSDSGDSEQALQTVQGFTVAEVHLPLLSSSDGILRDPLVLEITNNDEVPEPEFSHGVISEQKGEDSEPRFEPKQRLEPKNDDDSRIRRPLEAEENTDSDESYAHLK